MSAKGVSVSVDAIETEALKMLEEAKAKAREILNVNSLSPLCLNVLINRMNHWILQVSSKTVEKP